MTRGCSDPTLKHWRCHRSSPCPRSDPPRRKAFEGTRHVGEVRYASANQQHLAGKELWFTPKKHSKSRVQPVPFESLENGKCAICVFLGKGIYAIVVEKRWKVDENRSFGRSKSGDTPVWLARSHLSPIKIEIQPSKIGKKWSSPTNLWTYQSKWWHLNTGEATHETSNSQLECK